MEISNGVDRLYSFIKSKLPLSVYPEKDTNILVPPPLKVIPFGNVEPPSSKTICWSSTSVTIAPKE